jgi:hypothetical protein
MFFVVFGSLHSDMARFAGLLGLSVSLNGGVCQRAPKVAPELKKATNLATIIPRPAFQ